MTNSPEKAARSYRLPIRRPVTTVMIFITLVVFGWRSYQKLPINLMPDISYPTLTVRTEYEGAAPVDVEKLVTRPIEEQLSVVGGLVEISSISSAGISEVVMEFTWGTDMAMAQQDVRDRLDLFRPPEGVTEKPVILRYDPSLDPVMRVALTLSDENNTDLTQEQHEHALTLLRDRTERYIKSDLEAESGVAQVSVKGGQEEEIQVLVNTAQLKSYGMTLQHIVDSLAQQNINWTGGELKEGSRDYLVRVVNEFTTIEEIAASIIITPTGQKVRLDALANVFLGAKERDTIVHINGTEAVALDIFKEGDANTVLVCQRVKDLFGVQRKLPLFKRFQSRFISKIKENNPEETVDKQEILGDLIPGFRQLMKRLPEGVECTVISDQSRFISASIKEVKDATILGGILALLILYVFLREVKATAIVGVAIPISVIATFVPMFIRDISLNIMSLGGLALGVGMLVDNSIVVLESIFRCKEEGDDIVDAADRGTGEVGGAVTASTLTTISVFLPIVFVEGIAGQLFGDMALTVTFSLLASLLTALYLIPMIASRRGLQLRKNEQNFWLIRGYVKNRKNGAAISNALGKLPSSYVLQTADYIKTTWRSNFAPIQNAYTALREKKTILRLLYAMLITFPGSIIFALLTALQLILRLMLANFELGLFFCVGFIVLIIWAIAKVLHWIFWAPLAAFDYFFNKFRDAYAVVLSHSFRFSVIILLGILALSVHSGMLAVDLGRELIPPMNQGEFGIRMEAKAGTRLSTTEARARRLEHLIQSHEMIDSVTVEIGQEGSNNRNEGGENVASFTVLIKDPEKNARQQNVIMEELRRQIAAITLDDITFTLPTLFSFKNPIEVQLFGDDLEQLKHIGQMALNKVSSIAGIKDAELSIKPGYPELIIEPIDEKLALHNIPPLALGQMVSEEVQGEIATRFSRAGEKVPIRVRTDQEQMRSIQDLEQMNVVEGGQYLPLSSVADISIEEGPSEIRRIDQRQVVLITANLEGRDLGAVKNDIQAAIRDIDKPETYFFMMGGQSRELETSYNSLRFALLLAIFLVYVVMACQFESFWHPALVMFAVPLAFIGVIYVLAWSNSDLSIMVFLGGIILAGIVVNDAIVLVDYINQLRKRGLPRREAIVEAGKVRLRPIIMTTVTTVLGLLPMILTSGEGAEMRRPMAVTVMAGLSAATLLTLLIIPMAYDLFSGKDKPGETA